MGWDFTGLGSACDLIGKVLDKVVPDKAVAEQSKIQLLQLQQAGAFKELDAMLTIAAQQTQVNTAEAQSGSNFRGGWRPFIGWVCGVGLAYALIFRPVTVSVVQVWHPNFMIPPVDTDVLMTLATGMLGLGGMRSWEKIKGASA